MALSKNQIENVCNINGGAACCRYIDEVLDDTGKIVDICRKKTADKQIIDLQVKEETEKMKNLGQDINKSNLHIADNCGGYLLLKSKPQGYDVD